MKMVRPVVYLYIKLLPRPMLISVQCEAASRLHLLLFHRFLFISSSSGAATHEEPLSLLRLLPIEHFINLTDIITLM
jgi:hypothetical protein